MNVEKTYNNNRKINYNGYTIPRRGRIYSLIDKLLIWHYQAKLCLLFMLAFIGPKMIYFNCMFCKKVIICCRSNFRVIFFLRTQVLTIFIEKTSIRLFRISASEGRNKKYVCRVTKFNIRLAYWLQLDYLGCIECTGDTIKEIQCGICSKSLAVIIFPR